MVKHYVETNTKPKQNREDLFSDLIAKKLAKFLTVTQNQLLVTFRKFDTNYREQNTVK